MVCLAQASSHPLAKMLLGVDEERYRELVRELARKSPLMGYNNRKAWLAVVEIVLGHIKPGRDRWREYRTMVEAPPCRGRGDNKAIVYTTITNHYMHLGYQCIPKGSSIAWDTIPIGVDTSVTSVFAASIRPSGEVTTHPVWLYNLYDLFYKGLGTGARPLLELAKRAEEKGDREVASVLKKLYAILEASKDIIEEIEQADYSQVKVEVDEREVERRVEEAVGLLRKAKELARKGDIKSLIDLIISNKVALSRWHEIPLNDIAYYLETGEGSRIRDLLSYNPRDLGEILREEDIYDVFITAAEHFGLEVRKG